MTTQKKGGGFLFPLILVLIGVLFLLSNLGVIDGIAWSEVVRYWPVLLILLGIDTLLQRRSAAAAVASLLTALVLIAIGMAAVYLFAPDTWITDEQSLHLTRDGAASAELLLSCRDCAVDLRAVADDAAADVLVQGSLTMARDTKLVETVRRESDRVIVHLESESRLPFVLSARRGALPWTLALTDRLPVSLSVRTDGDVDLDLRGLDVPWVELAAGDGACTLIPSDRIDASIALTGADIELLIPVGVGVRILGSAEFDLTVPEDYVSVDGAVQSPNFEDTAIQSLVTLQLGAERVEVRPLPEDAAQD